MTETKGKLRARAKRLRERRWSYRRIALWIRANYGLELSAPQVRDMILDGHHPQNVQDHYRPVRHRVALEASTPEQAAVLRAVLDATGMSRRELGDALAAGEWEIREAA